jgi:hypothetical protein
MSNKRIRNKLQTRSITLESRKQELANTELAKSMAGYQAEREAGFGNFGGASDIGRTRQDWSTATNNMTSFNLQTVTNRALRSYHSNTWLKSCIKTLCCNILSPTAIRFQPKIFNTDGTIDKKTSAEYANVISLFNDVACNYLPFYQNELCILIS